ncbi:MAG: type II toxin-antitoxin system VapC family toxin [Acidobacteria bacterium]|nr:type II toxin-antitoxin system VapC family toxin [Acidobacteriota bacterium]MYG74260.1 type II toxin-antitoxin system VapC family toxin [Acidobacteriota bacterium]
MIILDTNVISELMRPEPDPTVLAWSFGLRKDEMFTTAVSEGEVRYGVAWLPAGVRRTELQHAADRIFRDLLRDRILPFDSKAARRFAGILAERRRAGHATAIPDAQIAAIAATHDATLATRNTRDFQDCGARVINPWETT